MFSIKNSFITLFAVIMMLLLLSIGQTAAADDYMTKATMSDWIITWHNDLGSVVEYVARRDSDPTNILEDQADRFLFEIRNMSPGEQKTSTITVINGCTLPIQLSAEVQSLWGPETGINNNGEVLTDVLLSKQVIITTYLDFTMNPSLPEDERYVLMPGFSDSSILTATDVLPASIGSHEFPDLLMPGKGFIMKIDIDLPGEETGNEFQGTKAAFRWIFTAELIPPDDPPPDDPPPDDPPPDDPPPDDPPPRERRERERERDNGTTITDPEPPTTDIPEPEPPVTDIELPDPPLGEKIMPKTGEAPLWYSVLPGIMLVMLGMALLMRKKDPLAE